MPARRKASPATPSYYVVMVSYEGGREAVVDPELTRRDIVSRIRTREYDRDKIDFIHFVDGTGWEDLTEELKAEAGIASGEGPPSPADRQAARFDHARDLRRHSELA